MPKKSGLYSNINAKRKRIESGSHERMAHHGEEGRPSAVAFKAAAKTAKPRKPKKKK
jgi:hypothetical protein